MNRIVLWLMSTLTVLVLLFGYRTSLGGADQPASPVAPIVGAAAEPTTAGSGARTVTGPAAQTRYGPVQVELTLSGTGAATTIDDVAVIQYPSQDHRDAEINGDALPILIQETLDQQSADVDMVSGATYTSVGYRSSLQAALDQAQA